MGGEEGGQSFSHFVSLIMVSRDGPGRNGSVQGICPCHWVPLVLGFDLRASLQGAQNLPGCGGGVMGVVTMQVGVRWGGGLPGRE